MRLIRHHEDVGAGVQLRESLRQIRLAEFVDHRHHQIRGIASQQFFKRLDAIRRLHGETNALTRFCQLLLQLRAVCDENHLPF